MKRIRLGMIGGGEGSLIGPVHRIAARLDDRYELIAAALSSDTERTLQSGRNIGLTDGDRKHKAMPSTISPRNFRLIWPHLHRISPPLSGLLSP